MISSTGGNPTSEGSPGLPPELQLYPILTELAGSNIRVSFGDLIPPMLDEEDPDRECFYVGTIVDTGLEEGRPWASIRVIAHKLQAVSMEKALPGFRAYLNATYPNREDRAQGIIEYEAAIKNHPEITVYHDLDIPEEPIRLFLENMPNCAIVGI